MQRDDLQGGPERPVKTLWIDEEAEVAIGMYILPQRLMSDQHRAPCRASIA